MADEVAYQNAAQIRQLQAERANAVAYGQQTRIDAVDKQLAEFGVKPESDKPKKAEAAEKAESPEPEPEKTAPQGRTTKQERQQTAAPKA
jgi:hypothetical protein